MTDKRDIGRNLRKENCWRRIKMKYGEINNVCMRERERER